MEANVTSHGASPILELLRSGFERLGKLSSRHFWRKDARRLRLCETLSLGNRGFVAVVGYQNQQFLVGGTSNSIVLLAQLSETHDSAGHLTGDEWPRSELTAHKFTEIE